MVANPPPSFTTNGDHHHHHKNHHGLHHHSVVPMFLILFSCVSTTILATGQTCGRAVNTTTTNTSAITASQTITNDTTPHLFKGGMNGDYTIANTPPATSRNFNPFAREYIDVHGGRFYNCFVLEHAIKRRFLAFSQQHAFID
jgi:hypothetical protein